MPRGSRTREEPRTEDAQGHKRRHGSHRDDNGHRHKRRRSRAPAPKPVDLPYQAKPLSMRQYDEYRPLFQSYLDIQKQIHLDDLDAREVHGRWKSFVRRWNCGELARSWYDASMLKTAHETVQSYRAPGQPESPGYAPREDGHDESDDEFGPAPPTHLARHPGHGPSIPRLDDLAYRNELHDEDAARGQSEYADRLRDSRKADRKAQKERLDELVPRADPGSRERLVEKKREATSTLESFRNAKESGEADVAEADLMGDDGIDNYKKKKKDHERQKNEREIRREEIARAREAERHERLAERREKEAKTVDFLRQIAQERFG